MLVSIHYALRQRVHKELPTLHYHFKELYLQYHAHAVGQLECHCWFVAHAGRSSGAMSAEQRHQRTQESCFRQVDEETHVTDAQVSEE